MQPSLEHDPYEQDDDGSLVTRFGTVVGGGVVAALVASVPAALRLGDGGAAARALEHWAALAAVVTPAAILAVGVLRRARVGVRVLVGDRVTLLAAAVVWWSVLELGLLSVFGALLRAKTHHHGLAGVTFAAFALASGVGGALVAARAARLVAPLSRTVHRVALGVAAAAAFVALILVGVRTARSHELHTAAALVDVLALSVACAIASARGFARVRALAIAGVPLAAVVLAIGVAVLRADPAMREAVGDDAPMHAFVAWRLLR